MGNAWLSAHGKRPLRLFATAVFLPVAFELGYNCCNGLFTARQLRINRRYPWNQCLCLRLRLQHSIGETLFHWQSQSTTAADSPTGQRYIHHEERGSRILLFVREFKQDRVLGTAGAYTYLGCARYVSHEGSRPMNVTWTLDRPIPAKYLRKTNKLVMG